MQPLAITAFLRSRWCAYFKGNPTHSYTDIKHLSIHIFIQPTHFDKTTALEDMSQCRSNGRCLRKLSDIFLGFIRVTTGQETEKAPKVIIVSSRRGLPLSVEDLRRPACSTRAPGPNGISICVKH